MLSSWGLLEPLLDVWGTAVFGTLTSESLKLAGGKKHLFVTTDTKGDGARCNSNPIVIKEMNNICEYVRIQQLNHLTLWLSVTIMLCLYGNIKNTC